MWLGTQAQMRPTAFLPSPQFHMSIPLEAQQLENFTLPLRGGRALLMGQQLCQREGASQKLVMPEYWPPQGDCLCLLRGGNMNNGKSESFFLITSRREQTMGGEVPIWQATLEIWGEELKKSLYPDTPVLMINYTIQSENSTELRDQAEGCQQVVELSGKAGCLGEGRTWAMPVIQMERTDSRCVFFSEWRVVCQEKTSWVICWLLKATWQLKQFLGTALFGKERQIDFGGSKAIPGKGVPRWHAKEQGNVEGFQCSLHPPN